MSNQKFRGSISGDSLLIIKKVFIILAPLIISMLFAGIAGINPFRTLPTNSDEVGWYRQIESLVYYGKSLGYWGYNNTHATIGRIGAWGPFTLWPYVLIGKITGWHYYSMILCNIIFLMLANTIFILLTKPDSKALTYLLVFNIVNHIAYNFIFISMAECLRYSMGVILSAMLYHAFKFKVSFFYKNILLPVIFLYFCLCYAPFAMFTPFFVFLYAKKYICVSSQFKKFSKNKRAYITLCLISIFLTAVIGFSAKKITEIFSSPFVLLAVAKKIPNPNKNIIKEFLYNKIQFLYRFWQWRFFKNGVFALDIFVYLILIIYLTYYLFKKRKQLCENNNMLLFSILFIMLSEFLLFFLFYPNNPNPGTVIRNIHFVLMLSMYLLCLSDKKSIVCIMLLIMATGLLGSILNVQQILFEKTIYIEAIGGIETIEERKIQLENILTVSDAEDPWENTIALYSTVPPADTVLCLPIGMALNCMDDTIINTRAKYVLIPKETSDAIDDNDSDLVMKISNMHFLIYEDASMYIFQNQNFS